MSIPNIKLIDVGVIIFDKVDLLDVSGPVEVFGAAKIDEPGLREVTPKDKFASIYQKSPLFNVKLVSVLAGGYKINVVISLLYKTPLTSE